MNRFPAFSAWLRPGGESAQRWTGRWLLIGFVLALLGAKFTLIQHYGSDLPCWDQWDGEGEAVYEKYVQGNLRAADLLAPHNEHRIVFSRLLGLGLFASNGQWDARLQLVINALLHGAALAVFISFLRRDLGGPALAALAGYLAIIYAFPLAFENTLGGFQSQFYFLLLFLFLHLGGTAFARPFSRWWWLAQSAGLCSVFAMASGLLSSLAVLALVAVRSMEQKRLSRSDAVLVGLSLAFVALGWLLKSTVPGHDGLRAPSVQAWADATLTAMAWPVGHRAFAVIAILPGVVVLVLRWCGGRARGATSTYLIGLWAWWLLQIMALSLARGVNVDSILTPRYRDIFYVGCALNFASWAYICAVTPRGAPRLIAMGHAAAFTVMTLIGFNDAYRQTLERDLNELPIINQARIYTVREFLATGSDAIHAKVPFKELPYPHSGRLAEMLNRPAFRDHMPASVRAPLKTKLHVDTASTSPPDHAPPLPASPSWATAHLCRSSGTGVRTLTIEVAAPRLGLLSIPIAGQAGPGTGLTLATKEKSIVLPIQPMESQRWKNIVVSAPASAFTLVLTSTAPGWIAVGEPVELSHGSWLARQLVKSGSWLGWIGIGMLVLGTGFAWCAARPATDADIDPDPRA